MYPAWTRVKWVYRKVDVITLYWSVIEYNWTLAEPAVLHWWNCCTYPDKVVKLFGKDSFFASLTLIQPGPGSLLTTRNRSVLASLSQSVNWPLPVSSRCVIEHCGFGNLPRMVRQHYHTYKERKTGSTENPPRPALYAAPGPGNWFGMLTDATPYYGQQPSKTSSMLGWSVITIKSVGSRKVSRVAPRQNFWRKNVKLDIKTSFITSCEKFKKICKTFLQEQAKFLKIRNIRILSRIWRQSWLGQLWPRPVELGLINTVAIHDFSIFNLMAVNLEVLITITF